MKKPQTNTSQATTTRNVLSFTLVLVIIIAIVGCYFGLQFIKSYALEVSQAVTNSKAAEKGEKSLSALQSELANGGALAGTADKLFSTPDAYEAQLRRDIEKYASDTGITVVSIDPSNTPVGTTPSDTSKIVTVKSPVPYLKLLQFLQSIEDNLPKMQITDITISRPAIASSDEVMTDKITISVLTR